MEHWEYLLLADHKCHHIRVKGVIVSQICYARYVWIEFKNKLHIVHSLSTSFGGSVGQSWAFELMYSFYLSLHSIQSGGQVSEELHTNTLTSFPLLPVLSRAVSYRLHFFVPSRIEFPPHGFYFSSFIVPLSFVSVPAYCLRPGKKIPPVLIPCTITSQRRHTYIHF